MARREFRDSVLVVHDHDDTPSTECVGPMPNYKKNGGLVNCAFTEYEGQSVSTKRDTSG